MEGYYRGINESPFGDTFSRISPAGRISESNRLACKQTITYMLLTLLEVSVETTCHSHLAISMQDFPMATFISDSLVPPFLVTGSCHPTSRFH